MPTTTEKTTILVPGSTSNLGPGFDALGLALNIYNTVTISRADSIPADAFLRQAADQFFSAANVSPFGFGCKITGDVPRSRGLGSSVTVRLGILHGLNALVGRLLDSHQIFRICSELEGHPDNAAASNFGGFTICLPDGTFRRYEISSDLIFVLLIPQSELSTEEARRAVPAEFSRADAVHNLANTAAIAAALASGRYQELAGCFADRIHQPYRGRFLPFLDPVLRAATNAGALGGWLSGSGTTVASVVLRNQCNPDAVAAAMQAAYPLPATVRFAQADNAGVRLMAA